MVFLYICVKNRLPWCCYFLLLASMVDTLSTNVVPKGVARYWCDEANDDRQRGEKKERRDSPARAVHKDVRWKLLEQLAIDQCSTESDQTSSIDPRAHFTLCPPFFSFLIIPVFFSCFFLLRHGPSIAVVWPFHPFPLAVDVNKSRHES